MKNIMHRILKIISTAIFIVLIIIALLIVGYIIRIKFLASHDELGDVHINFYTILTQSMYPTIKAGDIVITYKNDNNRYNQGDVITFNSEMNGGIVVTHRVTEVYKLNNEYSYKTKGDNNNTPDRETIPGDSVYGRVVMKIPKAGYIQQFLITKTGWIVAVLLPALGIIIYDILKFVLVATGIKTSKKISETLKSEESLEARKKLKKVVESDEEE